jgi:TetR/AcrR family transcriptional regulator, transcriptional repressor for nem operon
VRRAWTLGIDLKMRKSRQEAAETRKRIVEVAAAEFRKNGIARTGLADVMAAAGLTHGGFYKHFASKEELVAEACLQALHDNVGHIAQVIDKKKGKRALKAAAEDYLSTGHRDGVGDGCLFAALASELASSGDQARGAATEGLKQVLAILAAKGDSDDARTAEANAVVMWSTMVGALTLSRMVSDPVLSNKILKEAQKHLTAA